MRTALLLGLLLAACAAPRRPVAVTASPPVPAANRATLFYSDVELAPGRRFPTPLVRGTVNGKPAVFALDTGAQVSVIGAALAAEAKLALSGGVGGRDPSGTHVAMQRTDDPHIAIDGLGPVAARPVAVAELPPVFAMLGIAAIFSPQALAASGVEVVLDLPRSELRVGAPTAKPPTAQAITACRYGDEGFEARALVTSASVDGVDLRVEIDTGASGTYVVADSSVGQKLSARPDATRSSAMGAAGKIEIVRTIAPVGFGGRSTTGPVAVMPGKRDAQCSYDGRIGIDRLRACVVTIGERGGAVSCDDPGGR